MKKIKLAALALSALVPFHAFAALTIVRTSAPGAGPSGSQSISGDGKFQAFSTTSNNLGVADGNGVADIYVRNLVTSTAECVSKNIGGALGNFASTNPSLSADGRFVAFQSIANNLVPVDTNGKEDIFVFDRTLGTIKRVSVPASGGQSTKDSDSPSISGDGSTVAFASKDENLVDPTLGAFSYIYVVKTATAGTLGSTVRVPLPNAPGRTTKSCVNPSISQDGNFVAYEYQVADGPITVPQFYYSDIYVYNLKTGQNIRITGSSATDGLPWNGMYSRNPSISGNGTQVAFESNVPLTIEKANDAPGQSETDVYVARLGRSITHRLASNDSHGALGNASSTFPAISANGRFVSFQSEADNFYQGQADDAPAIYRKELATGELKHVANIPDANGASSDAAISSDGSVVSFLSEATNLISGDIDINSAVDAFVASFPTAAAVLAFDEGSDATPIVDVTGNYSGRFPGSRKPYEADVAMDESGKVETMGKVDGYTHPTKGEDVKVKGTVKTVNNTPTVSGRGNVKGGTMDGEPVGGSGNIAVPLVESPTEEGSEFNAAVGSGSATVDGERFKKPATMVSVPAESGNGSKDWSLSLTITEKTDSNDKPYLAASAILYLPNGDRTQFKERKLKFSAKTGLYSTTFASGIKLDQASQPILVNGKQVIDRKSRIVITELDVETSGDPRQPTDGLLKYKFLGQKGSGDLLDFL
jgi:hypothetical protein